MKPKKNKLILYTLPVLSALNLLDTFLSFYLLKFFDDKFEVNILASKLFEVESTGTLFLVLKVVFSLLLYVYWKKRRSHT